MQAFFPLIIFVVIFYFFILRPQKKRQKTHDSLVNSLQRGDRVITAGGFFGIVREVKDDSVIIEIAEGLVARVLKSSISTKINPEAPKAAPKAEEAAKADVPATPEEAPAAEDKQ
ncbi:MAG: preprotein translocase subunit YajC [Pyramidobacter sp.]|nr:MULTISPECIES: preprotein translocase subunit YajC [unclassified Pyramidobacter]MCI7402958.1 preprotein translocase subunit YajC [Pyramidobacter sp.]OON89300.1 preprotein translocase subunit YajC [Pyramidobacter sp. C12-8]